MVVQEVGSSGNPPPAVLWAQRNTTVLLTICLEDCKDPEIKIEKDSIYFKGIGGTETKLHELTIPLYKEIDPEKSVKVVRERNIELVLRKKDDDGYWPHLTKEKKKYHWLKVDFDRWQDEDSSEDENAFSNHNNMELESVMRSMGGIGGGDGSKPSLDDLDGVDSDDEDLPELE